MKYPDNMRAWHGLRLLAFVAALLGLLAATWWREALDEVLSETLPTAAAAKAGRMILRDNALALYLPGGL